MFLIPWRRRKSQPKPAHQQAVVDVESWGDRDAKVEVTQPKGFFTKVSLRAKVDLPPDDVYEILIAPDNAAVFKGIREVTYRKVLHDDKKGRQKVEVEQLAAWKFLMFSGSFTTRLYVTQDKPQGVVEFKLAKPGLMKDFAGKWTVQPFTQNTLDGLYKQAQQPPSSAPWHSLASSFTKQTGGSKVQASLVTLEQSLEPNFRPPKPFDGLIKGIAAHQLKTILEQLRGEVPKIKSGKSSLESWKAQTCYKSKPRAATSDNKVDSGSSNSQQSLDMAEERSMVQRVPLTCIADTIVTLPKADDVPPGEMHCMHIEQPGHSWDEWPTNSLWGAIAGSKKQRKQAMWFDAIMAEQHEPRGAPLEQTGRRA